MEEKEKLMRASQELLGDNQLPFDPNDPKVKELEEWECSISRSVIVEVGLHICQNAYDVNNFLFMAM